MDFFELMEDDLSVSGFSMQPHPSGAWVHVTALPELKSKCFADAIQWIQENGWMDTYYTLTDKQIQEYSDMYSKDKL